MPNINVECPVCRQEFSKWSWGDRQKKQCNKCKRTVCAKCCTSRFLLPDVDQHKAKRVCDECATGGLKAQDIDADTLRLFTGVAKVESMRPVSAPPSLDPTAPTSLSAPPADRPLSVATEPPLSPPTLTTQPPEHAQAVMPAGAPRRPTLQGPVLPQQHQVQGTSDAAVHSAAQAAKPQQQPPSMQQGQRRQSEATASVVSNRTEGGADGRPTGVVQPAPMPTNVLAQIRSQRADSSTTASPPTATPTLPTSSHHPSASTAAQVVEPGVAPTSSLSAPTLPPPPHASLTRPSPIATAGLFADIQKGKALRTTPTTSDGGSASMSIGPESGSHAGTTTGPSTGSGSASPPSQRIVSPTAGLLADLQRGKALKKTPKGGEEGKGARGGVLETKAVSPTAALQQQQEEGPKAAHSRRPSVGSSAGGLSMMQDLQMRQERRKSSIAVSAPSTTESDAATSVSPPPPNDTAAAPSSKPVCPPIIAARRQSGVGGDAVQPAVLRPYQLRRASVEKAAETDMAPGHRTAITGDSVAELIRGAEGKAGAAAEGAPPSLRPGQLRRASVEKGVDGDGVPEHRAVKSGSLVGQLIRAADGTAGAVGAGQLRRPSIEKGVDAEGAAGHRQVRTGSIVAELVKAAEGKAGSVRRGSTELPVPQQAAAPQARSSPPPPQGAPPSGSQQAAVQAKLRAHTKRNSISQPLEGPTKVPLSMSVGAADNIERPRMAMNLLADLQKRRDG